MEYVWSTLVCLDKWRLIFLLNIDAVMPHSYALFIQRANMYLAQSQVCNTRAHAHTLLHCSIVIT